MSWEDVKIENVEGIRKVKWDGLWHIMYYLKRGKETYDRVDEKTAMKALRKIERSFELPVFKI